MKIIQSKEQDLKFYIYLKIDQLWINYTLEPVEGTSLSTSYKYG